MTPPPAAPRTNRLYHRAPRERAIVTLGKDLCALVDAYAFHHQTTRDAALVALVRGGLKALDNPRFRPPPLP
mgnify:CR=1 FL=1